MRVIDCEQGGPEWLAARAGVATASRFRDGRARLKSGSWAKDRADYVAELAIERVTRETTHHYATAVMQRGTELEGPARDGYSAETGEMVREVGFCLHDTLPIGYSPDGLVGADGLIEVKCPANASKLLSLWTDGEMSEYMDQMQGGMWITGRQWCDLVIYHPSLPLLMRRVRRDDAYIAALETDLIALLADVEAAEAALRFAMQVPA